MKLLLKLLSTAAAAYGLAWLLSGVTLSNFGSAIIFALVLGLLNVLLRPILVILTIPITVFTLGLFLIVINALMILLAAKLLDGFAVANFWWAVLYSILLSIFSSFLYSIVKDK